jgi:licheninase
MTRDQLEELLRRLVSTGMAIAVVIGAPGLDERPGGPPTVAVEPAPTRDDEGGDARGDEERAADDRTADRTGAAGEAASAAARHGWGRPDRVDEFTDGLGPDWNVYDGPGHAGNGRRDPDAVTVDDGVLTITGSPTGTTAGMSWGDGRRYGRWEGRVRAPEADDSYHALMLLWPDAEDFPVGGEIDFMEMLDGDRQRTNLFLHYGEDNSQIGGEVEVDATTWHNWALEWTPDSITAYLDGEEWFRTTEREIFPPRAMHLAIQLDWFPDGEDERSRESRMEVDWIKQYPIDGADGEGPSDEDD